MDSKIDRRKNAETYHKGIKPSAKSEYFGKSYGQLKREGAKSRALSSMKNTKSVPDKGSTLAKMEKNDEGKTKIGNYAYKK